MSDKQEKKQGEFGGEGYKPLDNMSADKQRRLLQCWLMENMIKLAAAKPSKTTYRNYTNVLGESRKVRNNLISIKGCNGLFDLTNQQISSMIPSFALSKDGNNSSSTFRFESTSSSTIDGMVSTRVGRGSNVGFKSFTYEMKGGSPATSESLIEAKLSLHFASLADLYRERDGNPSFADLLKQPTRLVKGATCVIGKSEKEKAQNSDYYTISVTLGYNTDSKVMSSELRSQLSKARRTFNLTLVQHSVSFKEDGSLELTLEYHSYIDRLMVDADIMDLALTAQQRKTLDAKIRANCEKKEKLKKSKSNPGSNCGPNATPGESEDSEEEEDLKDEIEDSANAILEDKALAYSRLFATLFKRNSVFMVKVKASDLSKGIGSTEKFEVSEKTEKEKTEIETNMKDLSEKVADKGTKILGVQVTDTGKEDIQEEVKENEHAMNNKGGGTALHIETTNSDVGDIDPNSHVALTFFYFGDLLDAALECLNTGSSKVNNLKVLVGTFPYRGGRNIPLSNIPVSLQLFQAWWLKHVVIKEKETYPLKGFISDAFSNLIRPALSPKNCYGTDHLIPRLGIETISLPSASGGKCRVTGTSSKTKSGNPVDLASRTIKKPTPSGNGKSKLPTIMYYYIYATSITKVKRTGQLDSTQQANDERRGIYWLKAGTTTGLVKRIKFNKTDQPGAKEARIESEGSSGLKDRYNAEVEMYGTSLFKPGMTVFIDPITSSIEGERSRALSIGLGGYYKVTQVATSLEPGSYKTDLTCVWESGAASSSPAGGCK